jgi:hypothetical protein
MPSYNINLWKFSSMVLSVDGAHVTTLTSGCNIMGTIRLPNFSVMPMFLARVSKCLMKNVVLSVF